MVACGLIVHSILGIAQLAESGTIPQKRCEFGAHRPLSVWKLVLRRDPLVPVAMTILQGSERAQLRSVRGNAALD